MDILLFFGVFIVLPFLVLYFILSRTLGPRTNSWLTMQTENLKWYRLFILLSFSTLILFLLAFGLWYRFVTNRDVNLDNSGMGLVLFIPPLIMTVILLLSSILTWFLNFKRGIRTNKVIFLLMGLLTFPVGLLALCSLLWTVLLLRA